MYTTFSVSSRQLEYSVNTENIKSLKNSVNMAAMHSAHSLLSIKEHSPINNHPGYRRGKYLSALLFITKFKFKHSKSFIAPIPPISLLSILQSVKCTRKNKKPLQFDSLFEKTREFFRALCGPLEGP